MESLSRQAYEQHLRERKFRQFTFDGAINPRIWTSCRTKVLFLLKENYGYEDYDRPIDIQNFARGWYDAKVKTYQKAVLLAAVIQSAIERKCPLTEEEIALATKDEVKLQATLETIAVVNIKKHSGKSTSIDRLIRIESGLNKVILRDQIRELSPHIIVTGGTVCWHSLTLDLGLFKEKITCPKNQACVHSNMILCHANHPASRRNEHFNIYILQRSIVLACLAHAAQK